MFIKWLCNAVEDLGLSLARKGMQIQGHLWIFGEEQVSSLNQALLKEGLASKFMSQHPLSEVPSLSVQWQWTVNPNLWACLYSISGGIEECLEY